MSGYKLWLAKTLTRIVLLGIFLVIVAVAVGVSQGGGPRVSVISLQGVIEDSGEVLDALYREEQPGGSQAIVLRVDSPGGAVGPSEEIYRAVKRLKTKKPIVVSMGNLAASGGMYASAGASKIYAQNGTQTGSIGVIMQVPNFTHLVDRIGVSMITVKSGDLKDTGNMFRDMTDAERIYLERTSKSVHESFIQAVAEGRNLPVDKVRGFADGRVILGSEAKSLGLVDEIGDVYDAAKAALALANAPLKEGELPKLVWVNKKNDFLSKITQAAAELPANVANKLPSSGAQLMYLGGLGR